MKITALAAAVAAGIAAVTGEADVKGALGLAPASGRPPLLPNLRPGAYSFGSAQTDGSATGGIAFPWPEKVAADAVSPQPQIAPKGSKKKKPTKSGSKPKKTSSPTAYPTPHPTAAPTPPTPSPTPGPTPPPETPAERAARERQEREELIKTVKELVSWMAYIWARGGVLLTALQGLEHKRASMQAGNPEVSEPKYKEQDFKAENQKLSTMRGTVLTAVNKFGKDLAEIEENSAQIERLQHALNAITERKKTIEQQIAQLEAPVETDHLSGDTETASELVAKRKLFAQKQIAKRRAGLAPLEEESGKISTEIASLEAKNAELEVGLEKVVLTFCASLLDLASSWLQRFRAVLQPNQLQALQHVVTGLEEINASPVQKTTSLLTYPIAGAFHILTELLKQCVRALITPGIAMATCSTEFRTIHRGTGQLTALASKKGPAMPLMLEGRLKGIAPGSMAQRWQMEAQLTILKAMRASEQMQRSAIAANVPASSFDRFCYEGSEVLKLLWRHLQAFIEKQDAGDQTKLEAMKDALKEAHRSIAHFNGIFFEYLCTALEQYRQHYTGLHLGGSAAAEHLLGALFDVFHLGTEEGDEKQSKRVYFLRSCKQYAQAGQSTLPCAGSLGSRASGHVLLQDILRQLELTADNPEVLPCELDDKVDLIAANYALALRARLTASNDTQQDQSGDAQVESSLLKQLEDHEEEAARLATSDRATASLFSASALRQLRANTPCPLHQHDQHFQQLEELIGLFLRLEYNGKDCTDAKLQAFCTRIVEGLTKAHMPQDIGESMMGEADACSQEAVLAAAKLQFERLIQKAVHSFRVQRKLQKPDHPVHIALCERAKQARRSLAARADVTLPKDLALAIEGRVDTKEAKVSPEEIAILLRAQTAAGVLNAAREAAACADGLCIAVDPEGFDGNISDESDDASLGSFRCAS